MLNTFSRRLQTLADEGVACLDRYQRELQDTQLLSVIEAAKSEFDAQVSGINQRGHRYGFGGMHREASCRLYGLVRHMQPKALLETGVCNGVSSAVILSALERNRSGKLYSIDFPEHADTRYTEGVFWEGKRGATIPKHKQPGWLIPENLKTRWTLIIGRSQEQMTPLLERTGEIDFFLHDSEHSYECMTFEYEIAWMHLRQGGLLVSDDIGWNSAFQDFANQHERSVQVLTLNMAFIAK